MSGLGDGNSSRDGVFSLFPPGFEPIDALVALIRFAVEVTSRAGKSGGQGGESEQDWDRSPKKSYTATTRHTVS